MAESSIKNDLGKLLVNIAILKVEKWARKEFNSFRHNSQYPICLQLSKTSWVVGPYEIQNLGLHKWQVIQDSATIHTFYSKQAAVFYAVFSKLGYYKTADKLLLQDQKVGKYANDVEFYSKRLDQGKAKHDPFKYELWVSRYMESKSRFELNRAELEKTLSSAKYNKIWEKIL